jgi:hypothetical protein
MNRYRMRFAPQVWTPSLSPTLVKWLRPFRERKRQSEVLGDRKVKNQTTTITTTIEQRVQSMLDEVA